MACSAPVAGRRSTSSRLRSVTVSACRFPSIRVRLHSRPRQSPTRLYTIEPGPLARYTGSMRDLIQSFKYRDRHEGLPMFGRWLVRAGADILTDAELIVPVPLYPSRLWTRRFNQSALLSQRVSRLTGIPADCFVLQRVRRTASQVGLSPQQRQRNVAGAFKVNPKRMPRVSERRIVVVDDVITTGATAEACARVLKRAGAARVDILALARAVEPTAWVL